MSTLAVISYPQERTAGEAGAKLAQMQKEYLITLDDIAWVTKKPDGKLKLRVEHTSALSEAGQAHNDLNGRKTTGKILLIP